MPRTNYKKASRAFILSLWLLAVTGLSLGLRGCALAAHGARPGDADRGGIPLQADAGTPEALNPHSASY